MTVDEASYFEDVSKLRDAADQLLREEKWSLSFAFPEIFWRTDVLVTGNFDALVQFALDEQSKRWLRLLDERTGHKCTIAMFCMTILPMLQRSSN